MDFGKMLKQAQEMQEKVNVFKEKLKDVKAEGASGGGLVVAVMNGSHELVNLKIDDKVFDEDDDNQVLAYCSHHERKIFISYDYIDLFDELYSKNN